jgi:hypothetical protein
VEQRVRDEPPDASSSPGLRAFEQHGPEATALPPSATTKATSASSPPSSTVEPDADDLPVDGDERLAVQVVDVGEAMQLLVTQLGCTPKNRSRIVSPDNVWWNWSNRSAWPRIS